MSTINPSAGHTPTDAPGIPEDSALGMATIAAAPVAKEAPATEATTFFSLPRELRDLIYSYYFAAVYTQSRADTHYPDLLHDRFGSRAEAQTPNRLAVLQASRGLYEEGRRILYGENLFRLHAGSTAFTTASLTRISADLMQNIEISLYPDEALNSILVLQLFGTSQILRKSCIIRLRFREAKLMTDDLIEALKRLTGFKILAFEVDPPGIGCCRKYSFPMPWVSVSLACLKDKLRPALGPSTFENGLRFRRLIFDPQSHNRKQKLYKTLHPRAIRATRVKWEEEWSEMS